LRTTPSHRNGWDCSLRRQIMPKSIP